jgi:microsomal epoxide hydrolase
MLRSILAFAAGLTLFAAPPVDLSSKFVDSNPSVRIHVLESGQGGPAILFVPGWRFTAEVWAPQLLRFASTRRAVALDPRSQGESTKVRDGNTPEGRAADIHAVISGLKLGPVVLVGWSQGAQDVAAYLQRYGTTDLAGVVLVDSHVSAGVAELELHKESSRFTLSMLGSLAAQPVAFMQGMMPYMFAKPQPPAYLQRLVDEALKTPTDTAVAMLCADIFGVDRRPALTRLDKPMLVVASGSSHLLDAQRDMATQIKGARFEVIEGAGHALFVDEPDRFFALIETFLAALPPSHPQKP